MTKTENQNKPMQIIAGLDIGNGDSKCKLQINGQDPIALDLPSVVAYTTGSNTPKVPTSHYMETLTNRLDASVVGPGIHHVDEGRMFFGKRAITSGESLTSFNISNHVPKSQDSLSTILIDGIIASNAVSHYYKSNNKLPSNLTVDSVIAIPLPIDDYLEYRNTYKTSLMSAPHTVTIRNFGDPITVTINYKNVIVLAEGAAAQYAILKLGPKFLQKALDSARLHGAKIDQAYTGEMLAKATNSISLDIGDGNVNFPVITNKQINVEASRSINKGYGSVLDGAVVDLANTTASFDSRRDLSDFLRDPMNQLMPAQKATFVEADRAVENHKQVFTRDIRTTFSDIFRRVGQRTQVIYVYGGGATPMQKSLEPVLIDETKVGNGENIPILWMDSVYSRNLNRNGLFEAAVYGTKSNLQ